MPKNHQLKYRPLVGGVLIYNPKVGEEGTLGCILTSGGGQFWALSCHHVLVPPAGGLPGDPIYQPLDDSPSDAIATCTGMKFDKNLDCAAVKISPQVQVTNFILGMPLAASARMPQVGMRVIKAGVATGGTEGVVSDVTQGKCTIGVPDGFPPSYELSSRGDSGSIWIDRATSSAVALHTGGNASAKELAYGSCLPDVLGVLGLSFI